MAPSLTESPSPSVRAPDSAATRLFRTEHLTRDLRRRAARGALATLTSQGLRFVLQTGATVILARVLTPRDFGLVGMVTAVTGFVGLFRDLGLSLATVQRDEVTHEQVSTLFWINVLLSAGLAGLLGLAAPLLAWVYGEPELRWITLALAGTLIFGGLTAQHHALLRRQMRFNWLAAVDAGVLGIAVAVSIASAMAGAGHWALVLGVAAQAAVNMIAVWWLTAWIPGWPRRNCGVRPMVAFGGHFAAYNTLSYFARNADNMLIGWYWGAGPLGLYTKAYGLLMLPLQQIKGPIGSVAVPALSRLQADASGFRSFYLKAVSLIAFLTLPLGAAMAIGSDEAILLLLGSQWHESAAIFRVLSFALPIQALLGCLGWLFIATGRTARMLKWGVFSCGGVLASFVLGLPYGPTGVAIAYVAGNYILAWPVTSYAVAGTSISTKAFWGVMVKPFLATVVATTIAVATRWMMLSMGAGNWFAIAAAWVCLAGVYVLVTFYFFGMWMEYASLRAHLWKAPAAITPSDPAPSEPSPVT